MNTQHWSRMGLAGAATTLLGFGALSGGFTSGALAAGSSASFIVNDGRVEPTTNYAVRADIIGTAFTSGGTPLPITLKVNAGGTTVEPFGDADTTAGDINKDNLPITEYIIPDMQEAGASLTVTATSWYGGEMLYSRNSHEASDFVMVLRNGDVTPDISGFDNQEDIVNFLRPYLTPDGSEIWLHENQVIYLFELGTNDPNSSAADFQDAVILVTLGESPEELEKELPPMHDFAVPMLARPLAD